MIKMSANQQWLIAGGLIVFNIVFVFLWLFNPRHSILAQPEWDFRVGELRQLDATPTPTLNQGFLPFITTDQAAKDGPSTILPLQTVTTPTPQPTSAADANGQVL